MKIIDRYILKRFLLTFVFTLLILLPIAIAIDFSEKVDKFMLNSELTSKEIIYDYYVNFVIYYGNTFLPLALFLSVIFFTSRIANNTEIIAVNDAQVSFTRMLFPYFIGATLVTIFALAMNHYILPIGNKKRINFEHKYIKKSKDKAKVEITNFSLQLNSDVYMHFRDFNLVQNRGNLFSIDSYEGLKLKSRLSANTIKWLPKENKFRLLDWTKRIVYEKQDVIVEGKKLDTTFVFTPKDFNYGISFSQEIKTPDLIDLIEVSKKRGVKELNPYLVELYKRTSLPLASYILTLIAVGLSYRKKRGGMGINLAIGVAIAFTYVFFLKVAEVLGAVPEANPLLYVWFPNIIYGLLAIYLFFNARK